MAEDTGTGTGGTGPDSTGGTGGTGAPSDTGTGSTGTPSTGGTGAGTGGTGSTGKTPEWYEAEMAKLRDEAAKSRVAAKAAADAATQEMANKLGRALGLVKDDGPADPAELARQTAALTGTNRELTIEVAILRGAGTQGADPVALADSRTFMAKALKLDPSAETFGADVEKLIKDTVTADPRFKANGSTAPPAAGAPRVGDFGGGSGATPPGEDVDSMRTLLRPRK